MSSQTPAKHGSAVALIPAYNEGPRISAVLEVVVAHPLLETIIVIDDGSSDDTSQVAGGFPVQVLRHETNRGKGGALQTGLDNAPPADFFLFLDADLINLQSSHIDALLAPLQEESGPMFTIGVFKGGNFFVDLAQNLFPILNGPRAFKREFIQTLPDLSTARFGVEVLLNRVAREKGIPFRWVPLYGISHSVKEAKRGQWEGFKERMQMLHEVLDMAVNYHRKIGRTAHTAGTETGSPARLGGGTQGVTPRAADVLKHVFDQNVTEMARFLKEVYGLGQETINDILEAIGYAADEIKNALKNVFKSFGD